MVRARIRQRRELPPGVVDQLITGIDYFHDGLGNGPDALEKLREAWQRPEVRQAVYAMWDTRRHTEPCPWAETTFGK